MTHHRIDNLPYLTDLVEVKQEDLIPGRMYFVSDGIANIKARLIMLYHSRVNVANNTGDMGSPYRHFFEIPPDFIRDHWGYVVPRQGDNFEVSVDNGKSWDKGDSAGFTRLYRPTPTAPPLPELSLPQQSKADRIAELERILNELKSE